MNKKKHPKPFDTVSRNPLPGQEHPTPVPEAPVSPYKRSMGNLNQNFPASALIGNTKYYT